MPRKTTKHAERFLKKWVNPFGFGHYSIKLTVLPTEAKGEVWGRSTFNHEEEWAHIEVVPDGILPVAQVETLVLHELSHGLIELAGANDLGCEMVCNRISRLALTGRTVKHCNEWNVATGFSNSWNTASLTEPWMKLLVEGLPPDQRTVVNALYYEGSSIRATAASMGVSARTVGRLRAKALTALETAAEKLSKR